ncbi:alpha amylase C-terminal domain-containing protein, partial [Streptococcus suis]
VLEGNDDMLVFKRGSKGIVVLNKSQRQQSLALKMDGDWVDLMTDQDVPSDGKLIVPPKASMLLVEN